MLTGFLGFLTSCLALGGNAYAYLLSGEYDANHCEFYVDSLGVGDFKYLETQQKFIDFYLRVNEHELVDLQGEQVLGAGAFVKVRSFTPQLDAGQAVLDILDFSEQVRADRVAPGSWQARFVYAERRRPQTYFKEALSLAFFLDLRRSSGRTDRLWLRHRGADFTLEGIFADRRGTEMSIGIGGIRYPDADAALYHQKVACAK